MQVEDLDELTLFFVGGQGKSGTTWVQLLLDAHPRVSCLGEAHFFDMLAPAMHEAFAAYRKQLAGNNAMFPELPGYPLPEQPQALAALRAAVMSALVEQIQGRDVSAVGERTPANAEHLDLVWTLWPRARFLHVIRDPRDVAVSLWHHTERLRPGSSRDHFGSLDALALDVARHWASWMQHSAVLGQERVGQYLEVRYEDLLESGPSALSRVFEFLDLPPDPDIIRGCLEDASFEKLSGGRRRGQEDAGSHFRKGASGDWRARLDATTQAAILDLCGSELGRLGYADD